MDEKTYIGPVEAYEIMQDRGIDSLPDRGKEVMTVHAIASGKPIEVLGQDAMGFYIYELENK